MRLTYYRFPDNTPKDVITDLCESTDETKDSNVCCCSVSFAKKMLKQYGGYAWTEHIDRDGSVFEVTEVKLAGNNSRFKYNHHL